MKRDMDLIRKILIKIEKEYDGSRPIQVDPIEGHDRSDVEYNLGLLVDAGYVKPLKSLSYLVRGITWDGHEFLDAVRSDDVWSKVREKLAVLGETASLATIKALGDEFASKILGLE